MLLLTSVVLLCTALARRRRARQHARAPADEGCSGVGASERDKDSANEKSRYKISVRAARCSVSTCEACSAGMQVLGVVMDGAPEGGELQACCLLGGHN